MKSNTSRNWVGIIFIAIGLLWLVDNFNFTFFDFPIKHLIFSWQTILIIIGALIISKNSRSFAGYFLLFIGILGTLKHLHYIPMFSMLTIGNLWPLIIIFIGIWMILNMNGHKEKREKEFYEKEFHNFSESKFTNQAAYDLEYINESVQFSSVVRVNNSQNFKGGKISASFGSLKLDLSQAKLAPGENYLELNASFGGIELRVPQDWKIVSNITSTFGGFEDKRFYSVQSQTQSDSVLILTGTVAFGGGEIYY